jgi:aldehyde dehydrogenase (NAD+)
MSATTEFQNLVDGRLTPAASGQVLDSIDPSTATVWSTIPRGSETDIAAAVDAATRAFPGWWEGAALERSAHLRRISEMMSAHGRELAETETRDNGRPISETTSFDVAACVQMFHYFAGAADKIEGSTVNVSAASFNFTRREPLGVVGIVIPWNAPLSLLSAKVGSALAAGNTVVVKPAEESSASVLRWAALLVDSGLPPGVVNVVAGLGEEAGDALVRHPGVARVTFTGSTETARTIASRAGPALKQLAFELGGKSPNIVFADADLDAAATGVSTTSIFTAGAGQTCIAGSRILVEAPVLDEMIERIAKAAANVVIGDPMDPNTTMGPIVSQAQLDRVTSYLALGPREGAELVFGGRTGAELFPEGSPLGAGYYVEPTLFRVPSNDLRICQEEIFGPVAVVMPFDDDDHAVALANATTYGLAAGVWTSNVRRAHRLIRDLHCGSVWVNAYRRIHWALPFGGWKDSGYGRDSGWESILENTQLKTSWIDLS